jgi:hypothetical protein
MNTIWSQPGPASYLSLTFNGSGGATYTQALIGGVNVRDYNNDGGQNTINNTTTINVWNNGSLGQRLDRQEYILPPDFANQELTSVTITDSGNENTQRAIFAGLTVSTCRNYVSPDIHTSSGPVTYHPASKVYTQQLAVGNLGLTPVNGPVFVVLEDLSKGVSLEQAAGQTSCYAPLGSPYVLALPAGSSLGVGRSKDIELEFSGPSGVTISYTPLVVVSLGPTP